MLFRFPSSNPTLVRSGEKLQDGQDANLLGERDPHLEVFKTMWEREEPSDLLLPPWPLEVAWPLSRNLFQVLQKGLGEGREALWP